MKKIIALYRAKDPKFMKTDVERQKAECMKFAQEKALTIAEEYIGKPWDTADSFDLAFDAICEIKDLAENGEIDKLIVYSFYCIGRQDVETPLAIQALLRMGVKITSILEGDFI